MTLENKLLQKLAEAKPAGERHELTISEGAWTAHLTYDRRDEMSGRLWEVRLDRQGQLPGDVQAWADGVAKRVVGLMEPLKVIEVDAVNREALLRSVTPTVKGEDLFFYEVHLRGAAHATLRRFQGARVAGKRREQIGFALTHETLAKFAADVTAEK